MAGYFGGQDLCNRIWKPQTRLATIVGQRQAGSNTLNLPPGCLSGDLGIYYAIENTSATSSGVQAIAAAPSGWPVLTGYAVAQVGTTPVFMSRAVYAKILTVADIAAQAVTFTVGTLGVASACGVMVFRGATAAANVSFGSTSATFVNTSTPAKPANSKLMVYLLTLRADLNEVITPDPGHNWVNVYPGAMIAGAFFVRDPATWVTAEAGHWQWTTSSPGEQHNISLS